MDLRSRGFGIEAEISIKASSMGLSTKDIPIAYGERIGEAKLNGLKDGYKIACTIIGHLPYVGRRIQRIMFSHNQNEFIVKQQSVSHE
jgi:hypothetical protein